MKKRGKKEKREREERRKKESSDPLASFSKEAGESETETGKSTLFLVSLSIRKEKKREKEERKKKVWLLVFFLSPPDYNY